MMVVPNDAETGVDDPEIKAHRDAGPTRERDLLNACLTRSDSLLIDMRRALFHRLNGSRFSRIKRNIDHKSMNAES
jgi:hypothetical protein